MNTRRIASSLVLATAAFASVATSMALPSILESSTPIQEVEVTTRGQVFSITAEARAADPAGGEVTVNLDLSGFPAVESSAAITVALISEADPSVRSEQTIVVVPNHHDTVSITVDAWETCDRNPCIEDFRLEIRNATPNTTITARGTAFVRLFGKDEVSDPGDEVVVSVLPLGDLE